MKKKFTKDNACPCGSGKPYAACCEPYHVGTVPQDAVTLMRSRYTAYVFQLEAYLLATWHASTRPASLDLADDAGIKWISLQVEGAGSSENSAWVQFTARYKVNGKAGKMTEKSRFVREEARWYYVDGDVT
ncbi:SEC-C motif-containing protein [Formivibrio citricus]|uniref:UPF0225 protein SAMN05660284_02089 n=1 Tax=Formivibrio citricus TaxID=83765 RepID=A0A1I5B824_9NEIS|nr:YchJ family metal-binding protein [Formivibrio citricus]SFN70711.1 SEC-C motif-containing protein [Formivibrio citricus]